MRKGKLGVVLCLYPIVGFLCVLFHLPVVCALIFGFVLAAERDEWAGRQSLQALGLSAVSTALEQLLRAVGNLFPSYYSGFFAFLSVAFGVLAVLVYLIAIILSIAAILRVARDQEADLPVLSGLAYRAYGKRKPQPMPVPYQAPYPPQGQPPYPPYPPQGQPFQQQPPYQPPQAGGQQNGPQNGGPGQS